MKECKVTQILSMGDYYVINAENDFIECRAVIIATGISKSKSIEGETKYLGRGVSYCATCDGMLYKNKTVAVVAENVEGCADANFLSELCKKVYYIPIHSNIDYLNENIEIVNGTPTAVDGTDKLNGLIINKELLVCDGIFFIKNTIPLDSLVFGLETEKTAIKVNRNMETNLKHIYAAGDCTGAPYQIAKAVGEGLVAALSAASALDKENREITKKK